MISYKISAYMQIMLEDLQYWFYQRPVWFTGVWATRVWPALLGSFLLLLRRRQDAGGGAGAGAAAASRVGEVVGVQVIPRPHEDISTLIPERKANS